MLVREIMTRSAYHIADTASPQAAVVLMARGHVTSLPVLDADGQLVGIISEADILRKAIHPDPRAHLRPTTSSGEALPMQVRELMTPDPYVVREDFDVADVATVLADRGWKSVPVVKEGQLVGILSRSDVLKALSRPDPEIAHEVALALHRFGSHEWDASVRGGVVTVAGPRTDKERETAEWLAAEVVGVRKVQHAATD